MHQSSAAPPPTANLLLGADSTKLLKVVLAVSLALISLAQLIRANVFGVTSPIFLAAIPGLVAIAALYVCVLSHRISTPLAAKLLSLAWLYQIAAMGLFTSEIIGPMTLLPPILALLTSLMIGGKWAWGSLAANLSIQIMIAAYRFTGVDIPSSGVISGNTIYLALALATSVLTLACGLVGAYCNRVSHRLVSIIAHQASHDYLTNIANRRQIDETLDREIRRNAREKTWMSVLLIDIDKFKNLNDAFGHGAGDECLVKIAALIKGELHRSGDMVGRYGGEEFAVLLPETNMRGVKNVAGRIRAAIEAAEIPTVGYAPVTVTIGGCSAERAGQYSVSAYYQHADHCLYEGKTAGRNCSMFCDLSTCTVKTKTQSHTAFA